MTTVQISYDVPQIIVSKIDSLLSEISMIDDADPMESQEVLQGVAALLKLSNEAATIPLGLIKANADIGKASDVATVKGIVFTNAEDMRR